MFARIRRRLAFLLVLALLVTFLPTQTSRAADPLTEEEALAILQEYQIVRGDQNGNVNVADRLTRAQAAALFVRSVGMENLAALLKDQVSFADAKGHWGAGEIALAERLGLMRGDPNGLFRPDADISYVEIVTVLLRMLQREPAGPWDADRITAAGNSLGIVPPGVAARDMAVRGRIFWALARALTDVEVEGRTLAQKNLDQSPPVIRLDAPALTTQDERVTITGTATGASKVLIQDKPARLDRRTGQFSGEVTVPVGSSTITVAAYDFARNEALTSVSVERQGTISRLKITGPAWVNARSNTKLTVEATDSRGNPVPLDGVDVAVTGDVATFDLATTTLRSGATPGRGTLTLTYGRAKATYAFEVKAPSSNASGLLILPINGDRAPAVDQEVVVTVQVVDDFGRLVAEDFGRPVTLRAEGLAGVTITPVQPVSEKGITTYSLKGSRVGQMKLEAVAQGLTSASKDLEILTNIRILLTSTVKSLKPDGTATTAIRAALQDSAGKAINNPTNGDIQITLTAEGTDGQLTDAFLTIPKGRANSTGNDGAYAVGIAPGTVTIKGEITFGPEYSIQTLVLPVTDPLPGVKLALTSSAASTRPGTPQTLTLKVLDSGNRVVTTGSYAFQVRIHTSNGDPIIHGMPDGVTLTFQGSNYTPVDDGRADNDPANDPYYVVGRTDRGVATLTLRYNRSGIVTVTPVLKPANYEAYNPTTGVGPASPSTELYAPPLDTMFTGTPAAIVLTADSDLGRDQKGAATNGAEQLKVWAKVVDEDGAIVPNFNGTISLSRISGGSGVSSIVGLTSRTASLGVAEFIVQTTNNEGFDLYRATSGSTLASSQFSVAVHKTKAEAPSIVAIRGVKEGDLSPVTGYVGPDADYMDVQLAPQESVIPGEPNHWVTGKVYRKGANTPIFTSNVFDLASPMPIIKVPRSVLTPGDYQFEVTVNNAAGDSLRSPAIDDTCRALIAAYSTTYRINSATYDAVSKKLTLGGSYVVGGQVDPGKIQLVKGENVLALEGATVTSLTSTTLILTLADSMQVDPDQFFGSVSVSADSAWLTNREGTLVAPSQTVTVTPMATITHAAVNPGYKYLYLYGSGFRQGTLAANLITINGSDKLVTLNATSDRIKSVTDSELVIQLSDATLNEIMTAHGPLYVTAEAGWLRSGTSTNPQRVSAIVGTGHPVYLHARIISAAYNRTSKTLTLRGSGFEGSSVDPAKITFQRSTSGTAWTPSSTPVVEGTVNDEIAIVFSDADAAAFESQFTGRNVYVNTLPGWLVDGLGREALPVPPNSVVFTVPAS